MMLAHIQHGTYENVAATSMGIHAVTFCKWMKKGREEIEQLLEDYEDDEKLPPVSVYGKLYIDVERSKAQARSIAEEKVTAKDPLAYLRLGPGKTTEGSPGWTVDEKNINISGHIDQNVEINTLPVSNETLAAGLRCLNDVLPGGLQGLLEHSEGTVESVFTEGEEIIPPEEPEEGE